ncbi:hypothetical protein SK128_011240 [Halocaridina rubra]|uniref:N-acetyl-D-glucosamine kinase n=1 Tax=Halocaridina rubra TaxID=373956 RepID=A0AAN9A7N8_HALRR
MNKKSVDSEAVQKDWRGRVSALCSWRGRVSALCSWRGRSECTVQLERASECTVQLERASECTVQLERASECTVQLERASECTVHLERATDSDDEILRNQHLHWELPLNLHNSVTKQFRLTTQPIKQIHHTTQPTRQPHEHCSSFPDGLENGLCLSGCEEDEANKDMAVQLMRRYPDLAKNVIVGSDTQGSIATACQNGGIVLISGTGSNALLLNPDGKTYRCGGWGHLIGDEGGAYWIAARAVKLLFDEDDNMVDPPFNTTMLREIVYTHFELKDRYLLCSSLKMSLVALRSMDYRRFLYSYVIIAASHML